MHALRHVHELLVPGGTVADLHPLTEQTVVAAGRPVGVIEEPEFTATDLPNAEARLQEAIAAGLYSLEAETEFEFVQRFDDAAELLEEHSEPLAAQPELAARIRAAGPPFVTRERAVLRRLRALPQRTPAR